MAKDRKKILHVVNIFFVIPYFLGEQLRYFAQKGYREYIACSRSEELDDYAGEMGFEYLTTEISRSISLWSDLKSVWRIYRFIQKNKIGIVTGHTPKGAIVAMLAAWLARVPKRIYFRHGLVYETSQGLKRKLLMTIDRLASKLATDVVCVSPSVKERSITDRLSLPAKMKILHKGTCNGIDINRFNPEMLSEKEITALKENIGIAQDSFVIGFSGRFVRDKGIVELIEAFAKIEKEFPHVRLLLVGMFEVRDALPQHIIDSINNNPKIVTTGYVRYGTIHQYYAMMDVFILPSRREGFPTSVLEASAMQLPVVTTRATGCIDSIIDGETGFFADLTPDGLAEKITCIICDRDLKNRLGACGRDFVKKDFAQELIWEEIETLYS